MIWRNLGLIAIFLLGCLLIVILGLRWYTHHGQSLILPDYTGQPLERAQKDAKEKSFEIKTIDSIFIVGQDGGIILDQSPPAASRVKQRRKIYVTVSKYSAVQIPVSRLPILYGKSYERKKRELSQGFEINTKVIGRKFDAGEPDHILEVIYNGQTLIDGNQRKDHVMIDKGGTLEMILSKSTGGSVTMPDVSCKMYDEARFLLQSLQLHVGEEVSSSDVRNPGTAYVWRQDPDPKSRVYTGDTVTLYLTADRPSDCNP